MSKIIHGDCLEKLKELPDSSIDAVITDPPYGYSFMGKDWDKAVPSVDIWKECLRVLKPGAWCLVMSAPRSDVQNAMISRLMEAGFRLDFTPIYWTYASGFPKAGNIGKLVDKRLGAERDVIGEYSAKQKGSDQWNGADRTGGKGSGFKEVATITKPSSNQAKALDGSYAGFQPKPAVEVVIVAMKPLSEKTYVDQALANGKGITWLDNCRIPSEDPWKATSAPDIRGNAYSANNSGKKRLSVSTPHDNGRFPANLLVSDDVLNDGIAGDGGSYSRFFDLDKWFESLPFLAVPKASKSEKNKGLDHLKERQKWLKGGTGAGISARESVVAKNFHPTVKPLKLMSYLITLTTREGDTVLDPFVGSGTTVVAAKQLNRDGIGIERDEEYIKIAAARLGAVSDKPF